MPISDREWQSIKALIDRSGSARAEEFVTDVVMKSDPRNKLVWTLQFGIQPIPLIGFNIEVSYYDTTYTLVAGSLQSKLVKKTAKVKLEVPSQGDTVLIAREMGTHRLPRCLGIILGDKWVLTGDE